MLASVQSNTALVTFLRHIISLYFLNRNYCTVVYYDRNMVNSQQDCNNYCKFLLDIELALVHLDEKHAVMWITSAQAADGILESAIEQGCQSYIVATTDVMMFFETKLMLKETTLQRIRDKNFLLFVDGDFVNDDGLTIKEAMKYYPNLWFLMQSGYENLDFYTHDYSITNTTKLQLVQSYNLTDPYDEVTNGAIFYDKLVDLRGRSIPMAVVEYLPYCITTNVGANNGNADAYNTTAPKELFLEGLEGSLAVEFCRIHNCNILLWPHGPSDWGDIFSNGSGYGELYTIYTKETDLAFCCLYYNWYHHLLDGSHYMAKSTMFILVPGAKLLPTSLTVIYPFSSTVWLSIFIMMVLMTGVHHFITTINLTHLGRDEQPPPALKSIFDMISIYLDQGIFLNTFHSSYRVLICFILLSGVVISNSYASGLASVLTIPRYGKSLETIHDFTQTPYRWAAPADAWIFALLGAENRDIQIVVDRFDAVPDEDELHRRSLAGDYGIGIELLNGGSYTFGSYVSEDNVRSFDILKEVLYFAYTTVYAQRGWPMMEYFNKFLLEAIQFGFIIYWEKRTIRKYLSHRVQEALVEISVGHNEDEELSPLTTQHILGPMIILGIGLFCSLIMFLCELVMFSLSRFYQKVVGKKLKTTLTDIQK
ncbi:uncharacterized protein LOC5574238 [Aedes aegypti]|uniref:Uncharacterized protein n=1 Tax=Aedes aegypti TaxID=7159 RepID=A0A6I8TK95_AEDAE|nr:ionotropic receptor 41p [Aedes aegypti]